VTRAYTYGPERRLRRRADFVRVQNTGQRASTAHFVLLVAAQPLAVQPTAQRGVAAQGPETSVSCARFGVVVTRKIGNAVMRNRIKRVCRECFRMWPDLVPDGIDLVVIARAGAHELGLAQVRSEWERARPTLAKRCAAALGGARA